MVTLPQSQAAISASNRAGSGGDGLSISDFMGLFGGGTQMQQTGFSNVDSLISQGKFDEARQLLMNP